MIARVCCVATLVLAGAAVAPAAKEIVVEPGGRVASIGDALAIARPGDRILVRSGTYREPTVIIRTPGIVVQGDGWPVLDGEQSRAVLIVEADDVTVRGLVITGTGVSNLEDRAGIRVRGARNCVIEGNRVRDNLFGVYLERASLCAVRDNEVTARGASQATSGNGIHLWQSPGSTVERNRVAGHRDGIYFEFSQHGITRNNLSERNQRYGLHFMFSDSCRYEENVFRDNDAGVAVMYSRGVAIRRNRFERSLGSAAYGLLLKDILGGEISGNRFERNSTGIFLEGSTRLDVRDNEFLRNGWAARVFADATDNVFTGNRFAGNAFDVATNSRRATSTFDGNWWDAYRGYDLDRDGIGDVPFHPVRLFALVVERHPETMSLLRSPFVDILDAAERVLPVLTPETLVDRKPLMRPPR
jgi:nitrous oxidase accessory protein